MSLEHLIRPHLGQTGGLLSAIRAIQIAHKHIPDAADAALVEAFNLSKAEVKGVISFYADFHGTPLAQNVVRICAAEACQAVGGRQLVADMTSALRAQSDTVSLDPVYCLGLCSVAPAAMVNDELVGRATPARINSALQRDPKKGAA